MPRKPATPDPADPDATPVTPDAQAPDPAPDEPSTLADAVRAALDPDNAEAAEPDDEDGEDEPAGEDADDGEGERPDATDKPAAAKPAAPEEDPLAVPEEYRDTTDPKKAKLAERWERLRSYGQGHAQRAGAYDELVRASGANQEEFGDLLRFCGLATSGTPAGLEQAISVLEQYRTKLYQALGREAPGVDFLTDHADLREQVENLDLSREHALELAQARRERATMEQQYAQQREADRQLHSWQQRKERAVAQLDAMGAEFQRTDLHYAQVRPLIEAEAPEIARTLPPEQWPREVERLYRVLTASAQRFSRPAPRRGDPQPLRGLAPRHGEPEPQSLREAIGLALGESPD